MFSITDKNGTIFSADSVENVIELYRAFHSECNGHDGWIEWRGGECPFDKDTMVTVRFRSGMEQMINTSEAWCWNHDNTPSDIVAYKVVKNA